MYLKTIKMYNNNNYSSGGKKWKQVKHDDEHVNIHSYD